MLDKLRQMEENYHAMQEKMMDPDVVGDNQQYAQLMREYKHMQPIMEKYHEYLQAQRDFTEAKELLDSETDPELREMAQAELEQSRAAMETMQEELKRLLLPKDPNDDRNVIIEIRGGAGGDEASLFAASLYRMYTMYAETQGWKQEVLSANETELGGYKEISFSILGEGAYSRLKYESGVHRVQRVPETESQGRIHTSTVTVAVLVEADEVAVEINPTDLRIDVFRASGAGGQHINKTESAVRITHIPTGLVVECQDERSQYKNKDKAMKILRSRLYERMQQEQNDKIASERRMQVGTGDRSERIRTYNRLTNVQVGLFRLEVYDFSEAVFQEALLNALAHRSYEDMAPIYVKHYPTKIVIENPGGFPGDINESNIITHQSIPRNKLIAMTLQHLKYVQRSGQGVDIMFQSMLTEGKPYPEYASTPNSVRLTLRSTMENQNFVRFIAETQDKRSKMFTLSELMILHYLREHQKITLKQAAKTIQETDDNAHKVLNSLRDEGLLELNGKTYMLSLKVYETVKTDVAYVQDKTVSQIQAKDRILEYLKHKPSITNQKAQELCGFNKNQTYYILHQMCKDGILQPDGVGRGTKYKSVK